MMKTLFTILLLSTGIIALAQHDSTSSVTFDGYLEPYYSYDFGKPSNNAKPSFIYSHNRHNEVNLNLGFVRARYTSERIRANLALMAGTYANANLAAEPGVLKNVYEANGGVKISKDRSLWIDAGIFASHIGFESAVGKDCWNVTRSIMADNTPYYEAGAKITYTDNQEKWLLSALILNGWQRMQRVDGNSVPSVGTQVTFKPNTRLTLNSSTFVGTDKPDSARLIRYFHNLYGIFQPSKFIGLTLGFDYGVEEATVESKAMNKWFSWVALVRLTLSEKTALAFRGEYYQDRHGVIIVTGTPNGFKTSGISANFDFQISPGALWRIEARALNSKDKIFLSDNTATRTNAFVTTSLAISF